MIGFKQKDGDLEISNGEVLVVNENDLKVQTIQSVLSTNKGEWMFDEDEGIYFYDILGKSKIDEDVIKSEIEQGIEQVDDSLRIESFSCDKIGRTLKVSFVARTAEGDEISSDVEWQ